MERRSEAIEGAELKKRKKSIESKADHKDKTNAEEDSGSEIDKDKISEGKNSLSRGRKTLQFSESDSDDER